MSRCGLGHNRLMNIVVFGANRGVGRFLVNHALAEGHQVTAAVRNPVPSGVRHQRLRVVRCDVLDAGSVIKAMAGQDVAFGTLGTDSRGPTTLYSTAARSILQGMQIQSVRRLIFLSNFGVIGEKAGSLRGAALLWLARRMLRHTLADHRRALDEIQDHAREWVVVRPLPLTNDAATGNYRVSLDALPSGGVRISRADVAHFMLRQAADDHYLNQVPAIAY